MLDLLSSTCGMNATTLVCIGMIVGAVLIAVSTYFIVWHDGECK